LTKGTYKATIGTVVNNNHDYYPGLHAVVPDMVVPVSQAIKCNIVTQHNHPNSGR